MIVRETSVGRELFHHVENYCFDNSTLSFILNGVHYVYKCNIFDYSIANICNVIDLKKLTLLCKS